MKVIIAFLQDYLSVFHKKSPRSGYESLKITLLIVYEQLEE